MKKIIILSMVMLSLFTGVESYAKGNKKKPNKKHVHHYHKPKPKPKKKVIYHHKPSNKPVNRSITVNF